MAKGRRTDLPTAALVMEMKETEGRSEHEISRVTGIPVGTVHNIVSRAYGWDKIAEGDLFKRHREQQNKALEQSARTLAAKAYAHAEKQLPKASFYQAVYGGSILIDKARLLAGESTQNVDYVHKIDCESIDRLAALLHHSLTQPESNRDPAEDAIVVSPPLIADASKKGSGSDGSGGQGAPAHG